MLALVIVIVLLALVLGVGVHVGFFGLLIAALLLYVLVVR